MNSTNSTTPAFDPKTDSPFGFIPTLWICILFVSLFSLTATVHLYQTFRYRPIWWWLPTTFTCGVVEIIGWAGRVWGSQNPWTMPPYLMQICCTIFAPSFMTAGLFIIFVRIIVMVGPEYSRLTPKLYSWLFIGVDVVALVIQSIGGAQAAMASTTQGSQDGAHVMVGGIILQMAAITVYVLVSIEYFWRVYSDKPLRPRTSIDQSVLLRPAGPELGQSPSSGSVQAEKDTIEPTGQERLTRNVRTMVLGLIITTIFVYIRAIYRTIELLDGWGGPIITNQTLFNCLDGVPIFLAMLTLNVFHPGRLIPVPRASTIIA